MKVRDAQGHQNGVFLFTETRLMSFLVKILNPSLHLRREAVRAVKEMPGIEKAAVAKLLANISNTAQKTGLRPGKDSDIHKLGSISQSLANDRPVRYEGKALPHMVRNIKHTAQRQLDDLLSKSAGMKPDSQLARDIRTISDFIDSTRGFSAQVIEAHRNATK